MKVRIFIFLIMIASMHNTIFGTDPKSPVTPNSSVEATELLNFIYSISGKYTLCGQHDQPLYGYAFYQRVYETTGKYPALHGFDFGFSERNTLDGINFRQQMVDDAIALHKEGTIITFMWHAVPPNRDEPVKFRDGIMSKLTDTEWKELLTPDSPLNKRWQSQVDVIAFFLKQLQDAKVPVLWRPYHEMNGKWFWWGNRPGNEGYMALYKMLFDRFVNYHELNNLIWIYNANELKDSTVADYDAFYPGNDFVDILATDVYRKNYQEKDYAELLRLADGRPIALGEVGKLPTSEILQQQSQWVWFMTWSDLVLSANKPEDVILIYDSEHTLDRVEMNRIRKINN